MMIFCVTNEAERILESGFVNEEFPDLLPGVLCSNDPPYRDINHAGVVNYNIAPPFDCGNVIRSTPLCIEIDDYILDECIVSEYPYWDPVEAPEEAEQDDFKVCHYVIPASVLNEHGTVWIADEDDLVREHLEEMNIRRRAECMSEIEKLTKWASTRKRGIETRAETSGGHQEDDSAS